jgi:hypothetical protein
VAVSDLDGDTIPDLVTSNGLSNDVSVLLGNGNGFFQTAESYAAGESPSSVAVADLDGDTVPDLVTANASFQSSDVSVLLGRAHPPGRFRAAVSYPLTQFAGPTSVAVADLDGDTIPDLVTANEFRDENVLLGNGDGSFQAALTFAAGDAPQSVAVGDLDGDTIPDVIVANGDGNNVSVLLGNGDGSFETAGLFTVGDTPFSVAVADLNGDSFLDLVTANAVSDDVTVLINLPEPAGWLMLAAGAALLSVLYRRHIRAARVH